MLDLVNARLADLPHLRSRGRGGLLLRSRGRANPYGQTESDGYRKLRHPA
jgi:hypothetical protein